MEPTGQSTCSGPARSVRAAACLPHKGRVERFERKPSRTASPPSSVIKGARQVFSAYTSDESAQKTSTGRLGMLPSSLQERRPGDRKSPNREVGDF
jgi:hypothetical protein